jgi:hypothetical protein
MISPIESLGIQIGFGAAGGTLRNLATGTFWSPCKTTAKRQAVATDLPALESANVRVIENTVIYSQIGIFMRGNQGIVGLNKASLIEVFEGVRVAGNQNTATRDKIRDASESSIFLQRNDNSIVDNTLAKCASGVLKTEDSIANRIKENGFNNVQIPLQGPRPMPLTRKVAPER